MRFFDSPTFRVVSIALGFLLGSASIVGLVMQTTRAASLDPGQSKLDSLVAIESLLAKLATGAQEHGALRVAFLGDSTVHSAIQAKSLPFALDQRMKSWQSGESSAEVYSIARPALGSVSFHFLARDIIAAKPDVIVWQLALVHTNDYWLRGNTHHEFAGRLSTLDLLEFSLLPIHELGLSLNTLLAYKFLANPGLRPIWSGLINEQSRVQKARRELEQTYSGEGKIGPEKYFLGLQGLRSLADRFVKVDGRQRSSRGWAVDRLGEALKGIGPDHILLRSLAKSLEIFRDAGIPVVIYLGPINIEYLRSINVVNENLLQASIQAYRDVAQKYGANFIDLHDVLPDASFYDASGHFRASPSLDPASRIIDGIHPILVEELERISEIAGSSPSGPLNESEL
jgi:hypothetical protein